MHLIRSLCLSRNSHHSRHHFLQRCCLYDGVASLQHVRDRGLDHAVEREKNLKPLINIKNLIISEPSKSIPLNLITQSKESLQIANRPVDFIRKFPSIFQEFLPGGIGISPHIKLTPMVIDLDKEEEILYQTVSYKQELATRLLKLLMMCRINKIPLGLIDKLRWELGLPQDYVKTVVPEFPDYFRVINGGVLELVCWSSELAVSVIEKKGVAKIEFPMIYSSGFEMDKKYKKWVDEWQKLPYISPYENAKHLASKSDESDRWAVGVLHEVLNLFVGKKAEKDNVLELGECLGLRPRFKMALSQHPGIFYLSHKIGEQTVVLKEGYKRGMLIEEHPLREMRTKYVKLMNAVKEDPKEKYKNEKETLDLKDAQGEDAMGDREEAEKEAEKGSDEHKDDTVRDYKSDHRNVRKRQERSWQRSKFEGDVPHKRESRRSTSRIRSSENESNNTRRRIRLRTETPASKVLEPGNISSGIARKRRGFDSKRRAST